jgi:hypothetical protein
MSLHRQDQNYKLAIILLVLSLLLGCSPSSNPSTPQASSTVPVLVVSATASITPLPAISTATTPAALQSETLLPTSTPAATTAAPPLAATTTIATEIPAASSTPTITPSGAVLRAQVLLRSNCRYGPGEPYLYKYGLVVGSNLEAIGRTDTGSWIKVRAIGGSNPCWVKASQMDVKGDIMTLAQVEEVLPQSPYYFKPPSNVSTARSGSEVTITWSPVTLKAGDESGHYNYVLEAWVCRQGKLVFTPVGAYETLATIVDEPGCSEPSHARLYAQEKHGYTNWIKIPWPPAS